MVPAPIGTCSAFRAWATWRFAAGVVDRDAAKQPDLVGGSLPPCGALPGRLLPGPAPRAVDRLRPGVARRCGTVFGPPGLLCGLGASRILD